MLLGRPLALLIDNDCFKEPVPPDNIFNVLEHSPSAPTVPSWHASSRASMANAIGFKYASTAEDRELDMATAGVLRLPTHAAATVTIKPNVFRTILF
jgi:hypothetical protein